MHGQDVIVNYSAGRSMVGYTSELTPWIYHVDSGSFKGHRHSRSRASQYYLHFNRAKGNYVIPCRSMVIPSEYYVYSMLQGDP